MENNKKIIIEKQFNKLINELQEFREKGKKEKVSVDEVNKEVYRATMIAKFLMEDLDPSQKRLIDGELTRELLIELFFIKEILVDEIGRKKYNINETLGIDEVEEDILNTKEILDLHEKITTTYGLDDIKEDTNLCGDYYFSEGVFIFSGLTASQLSLYRDFNQFVNEKNLSEAYTSMFKFIYNHGLTKTHPLNNIEKIIVREMLDVLERNQVFV